MDNNRTKRLNDYPPLMKCRQVAEVLGVSESTLSAWRRHGTGPIRPVISEGKTIRYSRTDIKRLIETGVSP
jgi:predicted site-specific integrase-resolvase